MTRTPHILFINEFFHPDICASAAVLADRLPRLHRLLPKHKLTVICGNRAWDQPDRVYPSESELDGVRIVRVNRPAVGSRGLLRRGVGFFSFGINAVRAARRLRPVDLVVGTTAPPHGGGIARRVAAALRCPYVYTVLDLYPDLAASLGRMSNRSAIYQGWLSLDCKWMRDAARVVTIADGITSRIVSTRGLMRNKAVTIHDGFDPARLVVQNERAASDPPEQSDDAARVEYRPQGKFVVQYAGNMGLSHPFETIMAACNKLASDESILFQFVGGGPQLDMIRRSLSSNGVLLPYQPADRLGELLSAADVCLISQHEDMFDKALPYKIYGILAACRPGIFVGSAQSEIAAWLRECQCGVAVRQGDVGQLVAAIRRIKDDADLRSRMGAAGRRLLEEKLHAESSAQKWAALIEDVISADRGRC